MFVSNVTDMLQPLIAQAKSAVLQSRFDATTTEMTANNDVSHTQHIDSILNHRETIRVVQRDNIRHIAVNEEFAWQESNDFVRRHATIGTTDPQELRRLLPRQLLKKTRISRRHLCNPAAIVFEKMIQLFH